MVHTAVSGWLSSSSSSATEYFLTSERDQGVTPKYNLSYELNKDMLVYATASKGFRPGGGNQPVPTSGALGGGPNGCLANLYAIGYPTAPLGFAPDQGWSYELGEKFRSSDSRVTLNAAGYFENWGNIQQNIPLECGFPFTGNLGDAHIYGGEVELNAVVVPGLLFGLNGSFSHARFVSNPAAVAVRTTIDDRVQDVPDVTSAASLSYRHELVDKLAFISRVENTYVGSRIDVTAQPNYLPPYDLTNLRAGVEGGNWTAVLFVNNVTNRLALLTNSPAINVNVPTFNRTAIEQPLTFGIDVSYRLGR